MKATFYVYRAEKSKRPATVKDIYEAYRWCNDTNPLVSVEEEETSLEEARARTAVAFGKENVTVEDGMIVVHKNGVENLKKSENPYIFWVFYGGNDGFTLIPSFRALEHQDAFGFVPAQKFTGHLCFMEEDMIKFSDESGITFEDMIARLRAKKEA